MTVGRDALDRMVCQAPGCDHSAHDGLVICARCHDAPPMATYADGKLDFACSVCGNPVVTVAVAPYAIDGAGVVI